MPLYRYTFKKTKQNGKASALFLSYGGDPCRNIEWPGKVILVPVAVGGDFATLPSCLSHQMDVLQYNSILTLATQRYHQITQFKSSIS